MVMFLYKFSRDLLHERLGRVDNVTNLYGANEVKQNASCLNDLLFDEVISDDQEAGLCHNEYLLILSVPVVNPAMNKAAITEMYNNNNCSSIVPGKSG